MTQKQLVRSAGTTLAFGAAAAAGAYAAYIGTTWMRYGHIHPPTGSDIDSLLDDMMPNYEAADRHHVLVEAPADVAFRAAREIDLMRSRVVRAIFKGREIALGSTPGAHTGPRGLIDWTRSIGWGVLAEVPGREIVMGCATRPWNADVVFRTLAPAAFRPFDEPDYVKIAWMIRADAIAPLRSIVRTETRVMTTDPAAREKFRRYWAVFSPGIMLIRRVLLRQVRIDSERAAHAPIATPDRFDLVSAGDLDDEC